MSVSSGLNRVTLICCAVAVALVAAALLVDRGGSTGASPGARAVSAATAPQAREASKALDVVAPATSVDVSRRLFTSSPVAVLADPADPEAQRVAIATATALAVPVLVDSPEAPAEISRLRTATVPVSYTHLTLPTKSAECRSLWSPHYLKKK
ncbi:hypothetical protein AERO_09895 [Aeromicrobium fastidiosum]|uniref:hypothetical protein n=1 Tax=Aeromicrobium fastidiosum TaxID=52699 RepID=UPI00202346C3|nr:hypothetical protein [Aeromicrobium fastidiosum]MCL8251694.1 hypothetical protein [Aeromicrobium fastidiosum]